MTDQQVLVWEKDEFGEPKDVLGDGSQGVVFQGTYFRFDPTGESVAVKEVLSRTLQHASREPQLLAKLHHPNIVRYFGFERKERVTWIVLELCDAENLDKRLQRPLDESTKHRYCKQLVEVNIRAHFRVGGAAQQDVVEFLLLLCVHVGTGISPCQQHCSS